MGYDEHEHGVVHKFYSARGFGYLERVGAPTVFFDASEVEPEQLVDLREGAHVEFICRLNGCGRLRAVGLTVVGGSHVLR